MKTAPGKSPDAPYILGFTPIAMKETIVTNMLSATIGFGFLGALVLLFA